MTSSVEPRSGVAVSGFCGLAYYAVACVLAGKSSLSKDEIVLVRIELDVVKEELAKAKTALALELEDRMGLESRLKHAELALEEEVAHRKSLESLLNERKVACILHSKPISMLR